MNDDRPPLTDQQLLDAQIRALLTNGHVLAQQIAELTIAQQEAAKFKAMTDVRLSHVESGLQQNTEVTIEVRDLLEAFRGGFKVLGWLGTGLKWTGAIAGACTAIYTAFYMVTHGGQLPGNKP